MNDFPQVSIVIPTRNRKEKLIRLIKSILESDYPKDKLEIIVVDDASQDETYYEVSKKFPTVKVIRNSKRRFLSGSRNIGLMNSKGKYIFFIDDDNLIGKSTITNLVKFMERNPHVGIAVPLTFYYFAPNRIWNSHISDPILPSPLRRKINCPPKTCMEIERFDNAFLVRRSIFKSCGLFDEKNFPIHLSEAEFFNRMKKQGYIVMLVPSGMVWHDVPIYVDKARQMDKARTFYLLRNRILLARKRSLAFFLFFLIIFLPFLCLYHVYISIKVHSFEYLIAIFSGLLDGFNKLRKLRFVQIN
jgi:GT2 family glycosyltransferase